MVHGSPPFMPPFLIGYIIYNAVVMNGMEAGWLLIGRPRGSAKRKGIIDQISKPKFIRRMDEWKRN